MKDAISAPRHGRCKTRYCDATCQQDHWRRGHKQICKRIHRGGNAEQYNADKKYKETVAVAVEACAEDTKGQTLATALRLGAQEDQVLVIQNNLAITYAMLGRHEEALRLRREVYFGRLKLDGELEENTLMAAGNYALTLLQLKRFEEAKELLRKTTPVARRVLGNEHELTLSMREDLCCATLCGESSAEEEKREAFRMLEEVAGVMRRVLGPQHPETQRVQDDLEANREAFA